jgi:hypothetical protein
VIGSSFMADRVINLWRWSDQHHLEWSRSDPLITTGSMWENDPEAIHSLNQKRSMHSLIQKRSTDHHWIDVGKWTHWSRSDPCTHWSRSDPLITTGSMWENDPEAIHSLIQKWSTQWSRSDTLTDPEAIHWSTIHKRSTDHSWTVVDFVIQVIMPLKQGAVDDPESKGK